MCYDSVSSYITNSYVKSRRSKDDVELATIMSFIEDRVNPDIEDYKKEVRIIMDKMGYDETTANLLSIMHLIDALCQINKSLIRNFIQITNQATRRFIKPDESPTACFILDKVFFCIRNLIGELSVKDIEESNAPQIVQAFKKIVNNMLNYETINSSVADAQKELFKEQAIA